VDIFYKGNRRAKPDTYMATEYALEFGSITRVLIENVKKLVVTASGNELNHTMDAQFPSSISLGW
jgi:hypothetical protein